MVFIQNGELGGSTIQRPSSIVDKIAEMFWSIVSFFVLFFQTLVSPKGGVYKPAAPSKGPNVRGIHRRGGSVSGSPPFCGGGG
mmetsp:Transcript_63190/g.137417  ORF Transcript_63190/g.137417 Transcript_63190/m.137417 type:complete len:83 (+) Transcript_63190:84-332(+)